MPGMHGPELVERLRERRPSLPAVFLSGFTDLADAADRLPPGTHFLSKPYVPEELVRTIRRALLERAA